MDRGERAAWQENERERRAVERWRPRPRWYHPLAGAVVVRVSKFITNSLNHIDIEGRDRFDATMRRANQGLLTYSNHVSIFDDPLLTANFTPNEYSRVRWVASDAINFFSSRWKAWLFTCGKCVPVVRGAGMDQPGLRFLRDRLAAGEWVHIFPEGGRTRDVDGRLGDSFKPSIGRLIDETRPLVLPFYHHGMSDVLPIGSSLPRRGCRIRIAFGEAEDWSAFADAAAGSDRERWEALSTLAYDRLLEIERRIHPAASVGVGPA